MISNETKKLIQARITELQGIKQGYQAQIDSAQAKVDEVKPMLQKVKGQINDLQGDLVK